MMMAKMIMIMKGHTEMNSIIITENACRHAEKVRDKHAYILALQKKKKTTHSDIF